MSDKKREDDSYNLRRIFEEMELEMCIRDRFEGYKKYVTLQ